MNRVGIGSDNGLSPIRRQSISWTNAGLFSIGPLWTNLNENLFKIQNFSFMKMHLNISSATQRPILFRGDKLTNRGISFSNPHPKFNINSCRLFVNPRRSSNDSGTGMILAWYPDLPPPRVALTTACLSVSTAGQPPLSGGYVMTLYCDEYYNVAANAWHIDLLRLNEIIILLQSSLRQEWHPTQSAILMGNSCITCQFINNSAIFSQVNIWMHAE